MFVLFMASSQQVLHFTLFFQLENRLRQDLPQICNVKDSYYILTLPEVNFVISCFIINDVKHFTRQKCTSNYIFTQPKSKPKPITLFSISSTYHLNLLILIVMITVTTTLLKQPFAIVLLKVWFSL